MNADNANYWSSALSSFAGSTLEPCAAPFFVHQAITTVGGVVPRSPPSATSAPKSKSLKRAMKPTFLDIPKGPVFIKHTVMMDDDDFSPWSYSEEMDREDVPEWRRDPSSTGSSSSSSDILSV